MARQSQVPSKWPMVILGVVLVLIALRLVMPGNRFAGSNLVALAGLVLQAIVMIMLIRRRA